MSVRVLRVGYDRQWEREAPVEHCICPGFARRSLALPIMCLALQSYRQVYLQVEEAHVMNEVDQA